MKGGPGDEDHPGRDGAETTAVRLVHGPGDGVPGVFVDAFASWAVVHLREDDLRLDPEVVLDGVHALGFRGVYVKRHPKRASGRGSRMPAALTPAEPVRGEPAPTPLRVLEEGLPFLVELGDGLSVGLFLDQRCHRAALRAEASGLRVLNLFAYTCGFGLAAARGGAAETVEVDASGRALSRGRQNFVAAGIDLETGRHRFIKEDAFRYLDRLARRGTTFDRVVVDPPTFSTVRGGGRFTSGEDWVDLAARCFRVLAPGGRLLASSNDERLGPESLLGHLRAGAVGADRRLAAVDPGEVPPDFPIALGAPRVSAWWLTVDG